MKIVSYQAIALCAALPDWKVVGHKEMRQASGGILGVGQIQQLKGDVAQAFQIEAQLATLDNRYVFIATSHTVCQTLSYRCKPSMSFHFVRVAVSCSVVKVTGRGRPKSTRTRRQVVFLNVRDLPSKLAQQLSEVWECDVIDRFSLILQIFAQRAHTRYARIASNDGASHGHG